MNLVAGRRQIDEEHTEQWLKVRDDSYERISSRHRFHHIECTREELLEVAEEDYGVEKAFPTVSCGGEIETLEN